MTDERELHPTEEKPKETSGEYLWRVLKPAGAVFVLVIFVVFLVFCFTYRNDPAENAALPQETAAAEVAAR